MKWLFKFFPVRAMREKNGFSVCFRRVAAALGLLVLLAGTGGVGGCAGALTEKQPDDRTVFRRIAGKLDSDGVDYHIENRVRLREKLYRIGREFEDFLAEYTARTPELQRRTARKMALFARVWQLSGADDLLGSGSCSSTLPGQGGWYRNKSFFLLRNGRNSPFWRIFGKKNEDLTEDWGALPVGTVFACAGAFHLGELGGALFGNTDFAKYFAAEFPGVEPEELREIFDSLSGDWGIVVIDTGDSDSGFDLCGSLQTVVLIADKDRHLFDFLSRKCQELSETEPEDDEQGFLCDDFLGIKNFPAQVDFTEGTTICFLGRGAAERFGADASSRLCETSEFQTLSRGLPTKGIGFYYVNFRHRGFLGRLLESVVRMRGIQMPALAPVGLGVAVREKDGISLVSHDNWSGTESKFFSGSAIPALIGLHYFKNWLGAEAVRMELANRISEQQKQLGEQWKMLHSYAEKHDGNYPDRQVPWLGSNGAKARLYFPGRTVKSPSKLPLLIELFAPSGALALLADGSVYRIEDLRVNDFRKVIGTLHSVYRYSEIEFRTMFSRAAARDQKGEKGAVRQNEKDKR